MTTALQPIPHPPEKPIVGNAFDISSHSQVQDLVALGREYGEIFSISLAGNRVVFVSSYELVNELCDEKRFDKRVWAPLSNLRPLAGDGLFTAHTFEPNWQKAHNILLSSFSMAAMKRYHPMMLDIAHQMLERWQRLNPDEEIDVTDQMTRLTLDTIGLCGFDYRFNSFYKERMHPFVRAMTRAMSIAMERSARPNVPKELFFRENKRFRRAIDLMNTIVDQIIRDRRAVGVDLASQSDLLAHMLVGRDRETGEGLDDLNIRHQIITFLIAGHETTSGLLSFAIHFLLEHPDVLEGAVEEVDQVLGPDPYREPTYRQVTQLRRVRHVLDESLRLWPTAAMFSLFPKEGRTTLGGRYEIDKTDGLVVLTPLLHRDPKVWGADAEAFVPSRWEPERRAAIPNNAYKPFGNGQRACIGRQFALHEATLALGMTLQRFELLDHTDYQLRIKETLTLKPDDFRIRLRRRTEADRRLRAPVHDETSTDTSPAEEPATASDPKLPVAHHATPLLVLYGSNMGTAEGVARRIAEGSEARGFATKIATLDDYVRRLPSEGAVIIVSASYNGTPPDNAQDFCRWLNEGELEADALAGVRYAVFGCGHRDWASTYQRVPTLIDALLEEHGATRIHARGEGDGGDDFDGDFEAWYRPLWSALVETLGLDIELDMSRQSSGPVYEVEVVDEHHPNPYVQAFRAKPMVVVENRELLNAEADRSTRHIELALPPGVTYQTGDHLGVIAANDDALVHRVALRFGFDEQTRIRIKNLGAGHTELPVGESISVYGLLHEYVELQDPATRKQIALLAEHTRCPHTTQTLEALFEDSEEGRLRYREEVLEKRRSLIDLLDDFPACEVPFGVYLSMLPSLRPRYYSISSSPNVFDRICSLTVGVVEGPARSGVGTYRGVCSNYLAQKEKGSVVYAFVRDTQTPFRPPRLSRTPMILIGPGTGIAPFRGFLQDRAHNKAKGQQIGDTMLFFGCRHRDHDFLYQAELEEMVLAGAVRLFTAFSRETSEKVYVQHRLLEYGDDVWKQLENGAVVYVCGDATAMEPCVRQALEELYRRKVGTTDAFVEQLGSEGRYLVDVWATS